MRLSLGISTCPNDTFIYEALVEGLKNSPFEWDVHFADVQTLNEMVERGELDVAKVSAQVYPHVEKEYRLLECGGAIGYGCGPLLLSSRADSFISDSSVILPGKDTTAALLFKFWHTRECKDCAKIDYALFDKVYRGLIAGEFTQGVVIHEHRFTWKRDGLKLLVDLGAYWEEKTGTPIPLGISVVRRSLSENVIKQVESEIRESIALAKLRTDPVSPFIEKLAKIDDREVIVSHIKMFVNDFSENIGESGEMALRHLWTLINR